MQTGNYNAEYGGNAGAWDRRPPCRVRVTARSRWNECFWKQERVSSMLRWQHPLVMKDANRHRSQPLHPECEWKQGDCGGGKYREEPESASRWSAMGSIGRTIKKPFLEGRSIEVGSRLPLVADQPYR